MPPFCSRLQYTNLVNVRFLCFPLRLCGNGLVLSGRICLFNRWILFPFSAFLWFDFFCSVVHAAPLYLASERFCRYCILTVSLPSLFHFFSSLSPLASSLFLYLTCTNAVISPHLSLISWLTRDTTPHADTPHFSKEPADPASPAACGSPDHSRSGENTPGLWGRQGWPGGLSFPTIPTLWAHAALLHR